MADTDFPYRTGDLAWPSGTIAVIDPPWTGPPAGPAPAIASKVKVISVGAGEGSESGAPPVHVRVPHLSPVHVLSALAHHRDVRGVLAGSVASAVVTAQVADELALPGYGSVAAQAMTDRWSTHCAWVAAQCPTPRSRLAASVDQAMTAARHLGYPLVLRSRRHDGLTRPPVVHNAAELMVAYPASSERSGDEQIMVQATTAGLPVRVICLTNKGHTTVLAVVRPFTVLATCGMRPAQFVDAGDALGRDEAVRSVAAAAHQAVGVLCGITQLDLRITPAGPVAVALTPTIGGRLDNDLMRLATGVELWAIAAAAALGSTTLLAGHEYRCALAAQVHVPSRGRSSRWWQPQLDLPELTFPFMHGLSWDPISGPHGSSCGCAATGWVLLTGHDREHCLELLERVRVQLDATLPDEDPDV